jgi:hypothetical protein
MIANIVAFTVLYLLWSVIHPYVSLFYATPISIETIMKYKQDWVMLDEYDIDYPFIPYRRAHAFTPNDNIIYLFRTGPWDEYDIPAPFLEIMDKTKRKWKEVTQIYLSDKDALIFIQTYFPFFIDSYQYILPGAYKSDFLRLLLLYHFGGIYFDLGILPHCSFIDLGWNKKEWLMVKDKKEYGWYQGIMASPPRYQVLLLLAKQIDSYSKSRFYGQHPLDITGPVFIQRMIHRYEIELPIPLLYLDNEKQVRMYSNESRLAFSTKFDGYYDILYKKRNAFRYHRMWELGLVYPYHQYRTYKIYKKI